MCEKFLSDTNQEFDPAKDLCAGRVIQRRSFVQFEYNDETKKFEKLQERGELSTERGQLHVGGSDACKVLHNLNCSSLSNP